MTLRSGATVRYAVSGPETANSALPPATSPPLPLIGAATSAAPRAVATARTSAETWAEIVEVEAPEAATAS